MWSFKNKIIVISGASRGIGLATAQLLLELGATVVNLGTSNGRTKRLHYFYADVSRAEEVEKAIREIEKTVGPIYGVVANAGITKDKTFIKMSSEDWHDVIDTNLHGVFNLTKSALPYLYGRKKGAVVIVSSLMGERGNFGQTNYSASKAALFGFTKSLACESALKGVRINAVAPGFIDTDMTRVIPQKIQADLMKRIPAGRFGRPEEVGQAIIFLLSSLSSGYITGEVLHVHGGGL